MASTVIGKNVIYFREKRGWSQQHLALQAGVKLATLSAIETGRTLNPSPERVEQIATALEIPHACLFEDMNVINNFFKGDLTGFVEFQFKTMGLKLISYTPLMKDIFIGKAVLRPKSKIDFNNFPKLTLCFLEVIAGKLQTTLRNESFFITEGENLTLSSLKNHALVNPYQMKDTSFLIVSRPSLISANLANPAS